MDYEKISPTRKLWLILGFVLVLVAVNLNIFQMEQRLTTGTRIILKLAPVDPRSLMQGDYMILRYALADQIPTEKPHGSIYLAPDSRGYADSLSNKEAPDVVKLNYRVVNNRVLFDTESYFFQEGQASRYQAAEYVELKVRQGVPTIVKLLDKNFKPL